MSQPSECVDFKSPLWHVKLLPHFLSTEEAALLFTEAEKAFQSQGKVQKRRTNLMLGDREGMSYKVTFGYGKDAKTRRRSTLAYDVIPSLLVIKQRVEALLGSAFPVCALLRYPNGKYGIKRHRDREVPAGSVIAGLSVGAPRHMIISNWSHTKSVNLELTPGSLYIFLPPTNEKAFHAIEEEPMSLQPRISFTFRTNWTF